MKIGNRGSIVLIILSALLLPIIFVMCWYLLQVLSSPSLQYGLLLQEKYAKEDTYKNISTDELIKLIDSNKDWRKSWLGYRKHLRSIAYEEAMKRLASKTDEKALDRLKEIILTYPEGQKWTVVYAIGNYNNKAMVPVLCEALKRHTLNYTDDVIVKALVALDDPRALACFVEEREKLSSKKSYDAVGEAIEKWSAEITTEK